MMLEIIFNTSSETSLSVIWFMRMIPWQGGCTTSSWAFDKSHTDRSLSARHKLPWDWLSKLVSSRIMHGERDTCLARLKVSLGNWFITFPACLPAFTSKLGSVEAALPATVVVEWNAWKSPPFLSKFSFSSSLLSCCLTCQSECKCAWCGGSSNSSSDSSSSISVLLTWVSNNVSSSTNTLGSKQLGSEQPPTSFSFISNRYSPVDSAQKSSVVPLGWFFPSYSLIPLTLPSCLLEWGRKKNLPPASWLLLS